MPCWYWDHGRGRVAIYGLAPDPLAGPLADGRPSPASYPKIGLHGSSVVVDPDEGAAPAAGTDLERLREECRGIAPGLAGNPVEAATCLYTMSPDAHFLLGTRRAGQRVHFAAGLSGHGFKLSPALGDALADLALHGRTQLPVGFLSPVRFASRP
jgi:sarcosine oxidase